MQYEVVITLVGKSRGGTFLQGSYSSKDGKTYSLVDNGKRVVTGPLDAQRDHITGYRIEAGDKKVFQVNDETAEGKALLKFLKDHPLVYTKGYKNENATNPCFDLNIEHERVASDYKDLQEKLHVINTIREMDEDGMRDLDFALGGDPRTMSAEAVYMDLIGTVLNGRAVSNPIKTLKTIAMTRFESVASVFAHKAVRYGLAQKEEGMYKVNGRTLGTTVEQVANAFKSDSDLFDKYIRPEVEKLDKEAAENRGVAIKSKVFNPADLPDYLKEILPVTGSEKTPKGGLERKPGNNEGQTSKK